MVTADATWYARWSVVGTPAYYPGADGVAGTADDCDTADIVLANGQRWAACNVGATTAYVGQPYPSAAPTLAHKAYLGALYQWGRNEDVTALATTSTRAAA